MLFVSLTASNQHARIPLAQSDSLAAAFLMTEAVMPALSESGGSIVHISSVRAKQSEPMSEVCKASLCMLSSLYPLHIVHTRLHASCRH